MKKKNVLITGCSSGFGLLAAARLAKTYRVYATMRDLSKSKTLEQALPIGADVRLLPLDVTQPQTIDAVIQTIRKEDGGLYGLINNAGMAICGFFEDTSDAEYRKLMETNFWGVVNTTRAALPLLRSTKNSRIINISSIAGLAASPFMNAYNASKWALEGFSESLYFELLPFGVKVALVEPGPFSTQILTTNLQIAERTGTPESVYSDLAKKFTNKLDFAIKQMMEDPEIVTSLIEKIMRSSCPRFRHVVGKSAVMRYWTRRLLPFPLYSWSFKVALKKILEN